MNNAVHIGKIESLEQLRVSIAQFCEQCESQLQSIDLKLQTRFEQLNALKKDFQNEVESAKDDLRIAKSDLHYCRSQYEEDEDGEQQTPDCDAEEDQVDRCRRALEHAEHNYNTFLKEIRNVTAAMETYQKPKYRFKTILQYEKEGACGSLRQLITGAEDYLSINTPVTNGPAGDLGLAALAAEIDPTMILPTILGAGELMLMTVLSFVSLGGLLFSITNAQENGIITSAITEHEAYYVCSQLKIETGKECKSGAILKVDIPPSLRAGKNGRFLIANMEAVCRANDCREISVWANSNNVAFYKGLGFQARHEITGAGAEMFKSLETGFYGTQERARAAFEKTPVADFLKTKNAGRMQVDPLQIMSPEGMDKEAFWHQHGESQSRYIDLIEKYDRCSRELGNGKTLNQIRAEDMWVANAWDVFNGTDPVRLLKLGDYYQIDSNGRHRVAAAQLYFLLTGRKIILTAEILEKE